MNFHVCALEELSQYIAKHKSSHVLTVIEEEHKVDLSMAWCVEEHKVINFRDVWNRDIDNHPTIDNCREIVNWGRTLPENSSVLVHCYAGISRSTCATLALFYDNLKAARGNEQEMSNERNLNWDDVCLEEAASRLVQNRPIAFPNPLMAEHFDVLFNLNGKFIETAKNICDKSPFLIYANQFDSNDERQGR